MTTEQTEKVNLEQRRTDKFFGELAVEMGFLEPKQLEKVINIQKHNHIYLGEILVELNYITRQNLERHLAIFHEEQMPIASLYKIIPDSFDMRDEVHAILDTGIKIFRRMANLHLKVGKGFLKTTKIENMYLISSLSFTGTMDMTHGKASRSAVRQLLQTFFDGSVEQAVVAMLNASEANLSDEELDRLARLIADAKNEGH